MQQTSSAPAFLTVAPETSASPRVPPCGCAVESVPGDPTLVTRVDETVRHRNLTRLRRIEGQVRGLQRMIDDDRYCADILTQVSSVHEALRAVGRELMRSHLRFCASQVRGAEDAEPISDDIIEMIYRAAR